VWTNLLEQLHDGRGAGELDLTDGDSGRGVKLAGLLLERVQRVQPKELVHHGLGLGVQVVRGDGVDGFVKVLDDHVLRVGTTETVKVDEERVPGPLCLVTVLEGFESQEGATPGKGRDEIGVRVENVKGSTGVLTTEEVGKDRGGVVAGFLTLEDAAGGFEELCLLLARASFGREDFKTYVTSDLLSQHIVVTFPGGGREVVGIPRTDTTETAVTVSTTSTSANLETVNGGAGSERLQAARNGVQVGEQITSRVSLLGTRASLLGTDFASILAHLLLVGFVQLHHTPASEMQSKSGCQKSEETNLDSGVVEDLVLARLVLSISVLELTTDSSISSGNSDTTGQDTTSLKDNGATDPCQGAIDERRRGGAEVFGCLGVDAGEPSQHADVRDLYFVEEEETVVHGVVTELGADVTNVDILERLVGLEVSDLHNKGVRAVRFALDNELSHDDGKVGSAAKRTDPPFRSSQSGRVDDESLVFFVPRRRRLESSHVGAVAELRLGVTANVLVVPSLCEELFVLLWGALIAEGDLSWAD